MILLIKGTNIYYKGFLTFTYKLNRYLTDDEVDVYIETQGKDDELDIPKFFEPYREFLNESTFVIMDGVLVHIYVMGGITVFVGIAALIWHFIIEPMCWLPFVNKYFNKVKKEVEDEKSSESSFEEENDDFDKQEKFENDTTGVPLN